MNEIGLFEAKTKFSEICERVAASHETIIVTRRGKPLVTILTRVFWKRKLTAILDIFTELNMPRERDAVRAQLKKTAAANSDRRRDCSGPATPDGRSGAP